MGEEEPRVLEEIQAEQARAGGAEPDDADDKEQTQEAAWADNMASKEGVRFLV